jgi:hypothetical protein
MSILVIGIEEQEKIKEALAQARAKPMPLSVMMEIAIDDRKKPSNTLALKDRDKSGRLEAIRKEYPSHHVQLGMFTAAISFEEQPNGMTRHLSVSSYKKGRAPNEAAMQMVAEAFEFSGWPPKRPHRIWVEEYEEGRSAVNLVEMEPT